jgi:hypothetical protein
MDKHKDAKFQMDKATIEAGINSVDWLLHHRMGGGTGNRTESPAPWPGSGGDRADDGDEIRNVSGDAVNAVDGRDDTWEVSVSRQGQRQVATRWRPAKGRAAVPDPGIDRTPDNTSIITTTPPANAQDAALADQLAHGDGTPDQALAYFQSHGHPELVALPTFDTTTGLWMFPDGAYVLPWPQGAGDADQPVRADGVRLGGGDGVAPAAGAEDVAERLSDDDPPARGRALAPAQGRSAQIHAWNLSRQDRWLMWWGPVSGLSGTGTTDHPYVFPADRMVVPPKNPPPPPRAVPARPYATAEEEWAVAKESAWNWLVDKVIGNTPLPEDWLTSWRYDEPPEAPSGRAYELHESYVAMQRFLGVFELAASAVAPMVVESALANGLPSRLGNFLSVFAADESGTAAIGTSVERAKARELIAEISRKAVTEEQVDAYFWLKDAWAEARADMSMSGAPFESLTQYVYRDAATGRVADVNIGYLRGSRAADERAANAILGITELPTPGEGVVGWVWHHHPDLGRMILIPEDIHAQINHWGGASIYNYLFGATY